MTKKFSMGIGQKKNWIGGEESRKNRDLFLIKGGWGGSINNEGKQEPLNCVVTIY